jgi:hypothetical protein
MKINGTKILFLIALAACISAISFSLNKYNAAQACAAGELAFMNEPVPAEAAIVPAVGLNEMLSVKTFSEYGALDKRDLFSKFEPKKIETTLPAVQPMQTVVKAMEPRPPLKEEPAPVVEPPKPIYYYRGTVMLEGEKAYIVEQPEIFKTHFLKEGVVKGELILLDVGRYGITIKDADETIYELPIKKE